MKKAFCFDNCAGYFLRKKFVHVWFEISSVTSVDKREPRGTFLSLGLFISRPRPTASASKMRPRLQKTFPRFPFFYFGNFGQISNQTWTNFSSDAVSTKKIILLKYMNRRNHLCSNLAILKFLENHTGIHTLAQFIQMYSLWPKILSKRKLEQTHRKKEIWRIENFRKFC